jgi:hypothetical protein
MRKPAGRKTAGFSVSAARSLMALGIAAGMRDVRQCFPME